MSNHQTLFFQSLLERFPQPEMARVLKTGPSPYSNLSECLERHPKKNPYEVLTAPITLFLSMHASWQQDVINHCPKELQTGLCSLLLRTKQEKNIDHNGLDFFLQNYLVQQWPEKETENIDAIEDSALIWLATINQETILGLIDLLIVHQIVDFVRIVVNKKALTQILQALSPIQQRYLRSLLHRPKRPNTLDKEFSSLLVHYPKDAQKELKNRGVIHLGLALKTTPDLLLWHMLHHIDKELATKIQQAIPTKASPECLEASKQLLHAYQFLQKGNAYDK